MKRVTLGVAILLAGATLGATTWSAPYFHVGAKDFEVQASPCGAAMTINVSPFTFEGSVWASYLCADNRVVMRRFPTVHIDQQPPTYLPAIVCPAGFVHTGDKQGCVPPDHPSAGR